MGVVADEELMLRVARGDRDACRTLVERHVGRVVAFAARVLANPSEAEDVSQEAFARVYGDVSTDQLVEWDLCREMSFRIAWKPYMYNQSLPHLLGGVRAPALVVWGDDDKIVPRSAGERYAALLPKARLVTVRAAGHCVEMEQPDELATLVSGFIDEN